MLGTKHWMAGVISCVTLTGCASLNLIHDPQTGIISRDEIPRFLKSVRCELSTFYQANLYRRRLFDDKIAAAAQLTRQAGVTGDTARLAEADELRTQALREGNHFPVASELFGGVYMNLKIIDTLGLGAGDTNIVNREILDATRTATYGIAPSFGSTNTYEMTYSFLIDQGAGLSTTHTDDQFKCFSSSLVTSATTSVMLAENAIPEAAQFERILVNASRPLAAWLLDNTEQTFVNSHARRNVDEAERLIPVQMNYAFTVQVSGGVNAKYSLSTPIWSPAQIGGGFGATQSNQMSVYINGEDANLAGGAKLGQAVNKLGRTRATYRFVANPERAVVKSKILIATSEIKKLENEQATRIAPMSSGVDKTLADRDLKDRIQGLIKQRQQLEEQLKATPASKAVTIQSSSGGTGNRRGFLNAPVGIAPPAN